jgi:hypothetical protein
MSTLIVLPNNLLSPSVRELLISEKNQVEVTGFTTHPYHAPIARRSAPPAPSALAYPHTSAAGCRGAATRCNEVSLRLELDQARTATAGGAVHASLA